MNKKAFELFDDPVSWGEHFLVNRDGSKIKYWPHQVEDLRCTARHAIHLDGRDVGKTYCIISHALHFAFTTKGGKGLVIAPHHGQLDTIIQEVEFQLDTVPILAASVARNKNGNPQIKRKPYFQVIFTNGAWLKFFPAGAYGNAYRSQHVHRIWVDEGAWLSDKAWKAMGGCLLRGGKRRIYSTPNGVRNSRYYAFTTSTPGYKVYRWPSWLNPTWTKEHEKDLIAFYGGKNSIGWQHEVAGEHGKQAYGAFNIEFLALCTQPGTEYRKVVITDQELLDCANESDSWDRLEMLLNLGHDLGTYWIGGDLGYTNDPTELVVFKEEAEGGSLVLALRVHMEHVAYPYIAQTLAILNHYYQPRGIGIDNGGNGTSVVQNLLTLDKYRASDFDERLVGYDFGGKIEVEGPLQRQWIEDGICSRWEEKCKLKPRWVKEYMTELITKELTTRNLKLPSEDNEIEDQFASQTYTITDNRVKYSKGNDHIIDAIRCAMLVRDQKGGGQAVDGTRRHSASRPEDCVPIVIPWPWP